MAQSVKEQKFETWRHGLLDVSRRNRMINYRRTKRGSLQILSPDFAALFDRLVVHEETISFKMLVDCSQDMQIGSLFYLMNQAGSPVELTTGEIGTSLSVEESCRTLKALRAKSRLSLEEQGINILYLSFGFLEWRRSPSEQPMRAPLVLVPVSLTMESFQSPYMLRKLEEDIVVNPTLSYVLSSEFKTDLPDFEPGKMGLDTYLAQAEACLSPLGWRIFREADLGLLSFLKIVMYRDLEKNKERIFANPVVNAFCQDDSLLPEWEPGLVGYPHDKERPLDTWQVVNADSSQMDAILLSKKGYSFVLQGPPGTGKSQTITNIIAQGLADGKRILFVSEKMAALSVVYRRLQEVHLSEYCLSLHNYKADKKEVITDLARSLDAPRQSLKPGVLDFVTEYEGQREALNEYFSALHEVRLPLGRSLYDVLTELCALEPVPLSSFAGPVQGESGAEYQAKLASLRRFEEFLDGHPGDIQANPWRDTCLNMVTFDLRKSIEQVTSALEPALSGILATLDYLKERYGSIKNWKWGDYTGFIGDIASANILMIAEQTARNCFETVFSPTMDRSMAAELTARFDLAKKALGSQGFPESALTADSDRHKTLQELSGRRDTAEQICVFMDGCRQQLLTGGGWSKRNFDRLAAFLQAALVCEEFDASWLEEGHYERAVGLQKQLAAKQKQVRAADMAVRELFIPPQPESVSWADFSDLKEAYALCQDSLASLRQDWTDACAAASEDEGLLSMTMSQVAARRRALTAESEKLSEIFVFVCCVNREIHMEYHSIREGMERIRMIVRILRIPFDYRLAWVTEYGLAEVRALAMETEVLAARVKAQAHILEKEWKEEFLTLNCKELSRRFQEDYTSFFGRLGKEYRSDKRLLSSMRKKPGERLEDSDIRKGLELLEAYQKVKEEFDRKSREAEQVLSGCYKGADTDWTKLSQMLDTCTVIDEYQKKYGITPELRELLSCNYDTRRYIRLSGKWVEELADGEWFDACGQVMDGYAEDISEVLERLKQQTSRLQALEDVWNAVRTFVRTERLWADLPKNEILREDTPLSGVTEFFDRAMAAQKEMNEYTVLLSWSKGLFPVHFKAEKTDWDYVEVCLSDAKKLVDFSRKTGGLSRAQRAFACQTKPERESLVIGGKTISDWLSCTQDMAALWTGPDFYRAEDDAGKIAKKLSGCIDLLREMDQIAEEIAQLFSHPEQYPGTQEKLTVLKNYQDVMQSMEKQRKEIAVRVQGVGIADIWERLDEITDLFDELSSLAACRRSCTQTSGASEKDCRGLFSEAMASVIADLFGESAAGANVGLSGGAAAEAFAGLSGTAMTGALADFCGNQLSSRLQPNTGNEKSMTVFVSWFKKDLLSGLTIRELCERVRGCRDLEALNSWLLYRAVIDDCRQKGLGGFLANVQQEPPLSRFLNAPGPDRSGLEGGNLSLLYRKSFLTRWALAWLNSEELQTLGQFEACTQENLISRFRENDRKFLKVTQARLNERLSEQKPSGHILSMNGRDEISILRREAEKKRRVMPLRRLFKEIPTLLQRLKPCFMMSPLSVSYFLDSDIYEFDMVIFDEASQILPEDAIGAIYRGKQVIIAGDIHQMPPTNFFTASAKSDEKYDSGEDDSDEDYYEAVSESILEEANMCLPGCTLLWHYRSRDESLIAFSNREIYGNHLTTFPNCENPADRGLEYVYVPGGYYEGGGKNCNVEEAKRCVKLLEEHIRNRPDRSLGIIAFSEKQQGVIENAILSFRLQNPQYESFFDEEKEEPFFVKNLESVQGDERDTIIFSICYARNKNGRMYMRFGPLGHPGGERRLNVAITRAKYNVKLVGSILPNEIPLRETSAEGVRMLHDYICYAMQNDYGLPDGAALEETSDRFPDLVCEVLTQNGYQVRRNVGASEYKVDIAVLHPSKPDTYVAGIECDGENCVSARTARERDFLRKDIMESMGWHMYHAWSLAWYKNPVNEKRRLLAFLEGTIQKTSGGNAPGPAFPKPQPAAAPPEDLGLLTVREETTEKEHVLRFQGYKISDPTWVMSRPGESHSQYVAARILYVLESEQPVHIELLYRRLAPVFGKQKVTEPVKRTINKCLHDCLIPDKVLMRGSFLYLKGAKEIKARVSDSEERPIEYICPEEIQDALRSVVAFAYGIERDVLFTETAHVFGYVRRGPKITQILTENLEKLLSSGELRESDGKIHIG